MNPEYPDLGEDWDFPPTAIDWPKFRKALAYSKAYGKPSPDVKSHDHLNVQEKVQVDADLLQHWKVQFGGLKESSEKQGNARVVYAIVDGFLLYWDAVSPLPKVSGYFRCSWSHRSVAVC